jgi:methyl-accepting chemotaxis protein
MSSTDLLRERLDFIKMDTAALEALRSTKQVIMTALPVAIEAFYEQIRSVPETAKFFKSNAHAQSAGARQIAHWDSISSGMFNEDYVRAVTKVGEIHARIGLEPRWYIGGYAMVAQSLVAAVLKDRWPRGGYFVKGPKAEAVAAEIGALIKAIMLDMDYAISVYIESSEAARKDAEGKMQAINNAVISSVTKACAALADGNLTYRMADDLPSDYARLRHDFNTSVAKLQETMGAITSAADAINAGTSEMTQASDDLARRTENQAASIEETAAALDQITVTVRKTADGANQASVVVATTKANAEASGEVVRGAVSAMSQIEKSSKEITQIISVIDEIAFQTNLLALNAGVEAARAGDAGRGFAVVASEVRALAQRSAEAAREIKALISASTTQVDAGVKFVGQAGKALQNIVDQVGEINALVVEIAASAKTQSVGLLEVNAAVTQMDQMTQQNAAMVEESTAACHALAQEASQLGRMMGQFQIGERQGKSTRPVAAIDKSRTPKTRPMLKVVGSTTAAGKAAPAENWQEF